MLDLFADIVLKLIVVYANDFINAYLTFSTVGSEKKKKKKTFSKKKSKVSILIKTFCEHSIYQIWGMGAEYGIRWT